MNATKYPDISTSDLEELIAESLPAWIERRPALRRRLHSVLYEETDSLPERVSYEAFLAWADEDTLAEWVDGEIVMTSPASLDAVSDFYYTTRFLLHCGFCSYRPDLLQRNM